MSNQLIYDVGDKPKFSKVLVFAFQQVLAVLAATILVPALVGMPTQVPAAILGAGLGTLVYLLFTKFKSPVIISSSFAFIGPLMTAVAFGYMGIVLGAILAGLVYVIIAIIIKCVGTKWVGKLMPAVIIGPTVALIGLSLAGSAVGDAVTASGAAAGTAEKSYNLVALLCALVAFGTIVFCSCQKKFKSLKLLPFIIGIGVGYAVASIFSIFGYCLNVEYLKIVNWQALIDNFQNISFASFLDYPRVAGVEGIIELVNGTPSHATYVAQVLNNIPGTNFDVVNALSDAEIQVMLDTFHVAQPAILNWAGVATVALAFIPVAFVTFAEHIADHTNLGTIINKDLVNEEPGLSRTLLGDGIGSMVGTAFGICPNTTYGESVGCVAITKNASIRTIFTASIMLIVLSFLSPITALLRTIPNCVMGGVCFTLYGFIAVSGLKMFKDIDLSEHKNLFTVAVILITGIGGLAINIPYKMDGNKITGVISITSIATALILGILTHVLVEKLDKQKDPNEGNDEQSK